jgi:voltage-gated potassium channel
LNSESVTGNDATPRPAGLSFVERRTQRIVNARSVTIGLAVTFLGLAAIGGIVIEILDRHDFPSVGLAIWWALQTVTTVGYGDVVPTNTVGRVVGGVEMVIGCSFIAFLTAGVTSTVIQRGDAQAQEENREHREENTQTIVDGITETRAAITELGKRLDQIESSLAG